ncbi:hypothetical protein DSM104443_03990 [Usitatibacter rugosus]|uniref:Fibronectin type-III domain-containing protein n=1 Tax=Usitatibacter rugosus TaxID=2732067 RepID=A0A6M4H099_9PROT|nr:choice-of-anchor U domain-containing protein [Usitatibacter rugosus]QJR12896.1 hypothetical protein DSM104443_03990 [Usitatibacter rugosus]
MNFSARLGAFALAVSSCLIPTAAHAICNANDLASFQNCVATITPGDTLVLGANIDLTGVGFGMVNNDFVLANGAFMLTGSGGIPKDGPGNVTLTGANGFDPGTTLSINQGTVSIAVPGAVPSTVSLDNGAKLVALSDMALTAVVRFGTTGTSIVAAAPGRTLTLAQTLQVEDANAQLNDPVNNGTIRITASVLFFTPATTLVVQSGVVEGASAVLPAITGSAASTRVMAGALLRFTTANASIRNLVGNGNVEETSGTTLRIQGGDFGGQITATVLQKISGSVLRLSGTSGPGQTQILVGTLVLDGTLTSPLTVAAGGTLRGSGTVTSTVNLSAGAIAPGANTAGASATMSFQGVSFNGAQYFVDIPGPFAYDRVQSGTSITGTGATLTLGVVAASLPPGTAIALLTNAGNVTPLPFIFTGLPEGSTLTGGGHTFRISYVGGDGNDATLTVVNAPDAPTLMSATPGNGTATLAFTPNADGGSAILDYTATCGAAPPVTLAASPIVVTGLANGVAVSCTVTARNAIGTSPPSNALMVTPVQPSFSGPSATGTGTITAVLSGGGAGCTFAPTPSFIPVTAVATPPPAGVTFPHGLFDFTLTGCTPGSTATLAITYPTSVTGIRYWKFGPTPSDPAPHWYTIASAVAGNTITIAIVDGGLGDDDLVANGTIVDQGGPGFGPGGVAAVPTLSEWLLLMLVASMVGVAAVGRRRARG